jgi:glycosyltransferase involved in cell wall biosynthesis
MKFELNIDNLMLIVFAGAFIIQLNYFMFFFMRMILKQKPVVIEKLKPVSIIIAARNEEQNLIEFLPKIFEQDYPEFEIIVVNDRSWDKSIDILQAFALNHNNLHVVEVPDREKDGFAKKFAITLGIKAAKHELLVFIDADCYPNSKKWLKEMASRHTGSKNLILGASPYAREKGILNKVIRFDAAQIAVQYLSLAKAGIPYMGVGRNLSYTQELYDSVRGFKSHYFIPSGDDDLFVNEAGTKRNTTVVFSEEAITFSIPKNNFIDWWHQKKRHLITGKYYKTFHKILLTLYPFSLVIMYILLPFLLVMHNWWYIALGIVGFRVLLQMIIFSRPFKVMGSRDLILLAPFLEIVLLIINPILLLSKKKTKKQRHGFKRR